MHGVPWSRTSPQARCSIRNARWLAGRVFLLLGLNACVAVNDEPCRMEYYDCFCGDFGAPEVRCESLTTWSSCYPVAFSEPCRTGSKCARDQETCVDVCLESLEPDGALTARCGTDGLTFSGPVGLVVGSVVDPWTGIARPAVLTSEAYGATWELAHTPARPGCDTERYEQLVALDASTAWILSRGSGAACPPLALVTRDGGTSWSTVVLPATVDATGTEPPRLSLDPGWPGWLLVTGASPVVSQDDGATFAAVLSPLVDPGDGTPVPTAVAHAAVRSDPAGDVCVATAGAPAVIACGPADGSAWAEAHRSEAPLLGLGFRGEDAGAGWAFVGGEASGLLVSSSDGPWLPEAPQLTWGTVTSALAVRTDLHTQVIVLLSGSGYCGAVVSSQQGSLPTTGYAVEPSGSFGPGVAFAQAPGRVLTATAAGAAGALPSVGVGVGYGSRQSPVSVSGAPPSGQTQVAGMVVGLTGPITPPWLATPP